MNFQIAGTGRSFKGAFAYYLHDKRKEPDGPHLATAERVAWMEVRNLAVQEPEAVQGVMIATARSADELKAAAGVKATGRKSTAGPVFAYSIQWHPDNETIPDRAGMVAAAEATLKVLGAEGFQAAIIAHRDTAHPHVHVIVNRVDPATGKSLSLDKSALKLDKWAADYERERGQIVSPNRDKKHEARRQREAAAKLERDFKAAGKPLPVPAQARKPDPAPITSPQTDKPPQAPEIARGGNDLQRQAVEAAKSRAAKLAEQQAQQKERHRAEWRQLAALNKARRDEAFARAAAATKEAQAQHKADTRPGWSAFFRQERAARREMDRRETYLGGIISAAVVLAAHEQFSRKDGSSVRGFLSAAFAYSTDREARARAFNQHWQQAREREAAKLKAPLDSKVQAIKEARALDLERARTAFAADRSALIARQNAEAAKIRQAWRDLYAERDRLAAAQAQSRARMQQRGPQNYRHGRRLDRMDRPPIGSQAKAPPGQMPSPQQQERRPVKSAFERSADLAPAKRSPETGERVSVAVPAPAPAPEGVPVPPAREVRTVPADRPQAWAQTPEGQKATAPQKAAPDSLRRDFDKQPEQPRRPDWMAAAKQSPQPAQPAPVKDWRTAATPAQEPPKPQPVRDWRQDQDNKPKPTTPQRGRFRDDWERDR